MSEGTEIDATQPTPSPAKFIRSEITAYEREYKPWMDRGKGILDRYRDVRPEPVNQTFVLRKYNILWANVQTLKPTLYARTPQVEVERRFKDQDPVGRLAAEIAERMGNYILQTSNMDEIFKSCVQDVLLPGRAVAWVSYEVEGEDKPVMEDDPDNAGKQRAKKNEAGEDETEFEKVHEAVNPGYVDWKDFGHSPVRTWDEVKTVWCNRYLDKSQLIERFGKEKAETIPLDRKVQDKDQKTDNIVPQATIRECWHKPTHKVYWIHTDVEDVLDEAEPPIELEGFWPTPKPLYASLTNETLIPVPDFIYYQDQANELDIVTNRIARITDAIKAVGVYDHSVPALERILQPNGSPDNLLVPVDNWAAFAEKGGLAGAIQLVPIDMLAKVLINLYEARDQIIQVIYQVTGIADIIRGATDPNETLGAQKMKGQYGSIRIRDRQSEVAVFCRDMSRLIIECGIQMFEPQLIADMTMAESFCPLTPEEQQLRQIAGTPQGKAILGGRKPPPPQSFLQALAMLKDDRMRSFHIDIETDSTIAMDDAAEKQAVTEFITAVGAFVQTFGPIAQQQPALMPVAGEMLLYASRRYRAGRSMETVIEQAVQKMTAQASQPQQDPKAQAAQAKAQAEQARAAADVKIAEADVMVAQIESAATLQEAQQAAQEWQAKQETARRDSILKAGDQQLKAQDQEFRQGLDVRKQVHAEDKDRAAHGLNVVVAMKPPQPKKA